MRPARCRRCGVGIDPETTATTMGWWPWLADVAHVRGHCVGCGWPWSVPHQDLGEPCS